MNNPNYRPAGFFVLRAPLLPANALCIAAAAHQTHLPYRATIRRGLHALLANPIETTDSHAWTPTDTYRLRRLEQALRHREHEIDLGDAPDAPKAESPARLDAFCASLTILAASGADVDAGRFRLRWRGLIAPSGSQFFARFCHADPELLESLREHLSREAALADDAVLADVVHLPRGRVGNIMLRPLLRDYEIVYNARSGAPPGRQIPLSDLRVSIRGNQVVLRSRRLGKRVLVRITNAHNLEHPDALPVYRFLGALQAQDALVARGWTWGALAGADHLPRVVTGRTILAAASWRLDKAHIARIAKASNETRLDTMRRLREELGLPRHVSVAEGDNVLEFDLQRALDVDVLAVHVKKKDTERLTEVLGLSDEDLPLVPGSECLFTKIYADASSFEDLLLTVVRPTAKAALGSGAATSWFFLRYADPEPHLRVRFFGDPKRLLAEVAPALAVELAPYVADGRVNKLGFGSYAREIERYGGHAGIELAEHIFYADSEAVLDAFVALARGASDDDQWRAVLFGAGDMLACPGLDMEARRRIALAMTESYVNEFKAKTTFLHEASAFFRKERTSILPLLDGSPLEGTPLGRACSRLRAKRAALMTDATREFRTRPLTSSIEGLAPSFVHMHVNRFMSGPLRQQELLLYYLLEKGYAAAIALAKLGWDRATGHKQSAV